MKTPAAEVEINQHLVRALLDQQALSLATLPLTYLNEGWDNVIYQLGEEYLIRLPRRKIAVPFIEKEQQWLPQIAPQVSIAVPSPIFPGNPQDTYPWPWSITPRFAGTMAAEQELMAAEAARLATFLQELHGLPIVGTAPYNSHRGSGLENKAEGTLARLQSFIQEGLIPPALLTIWEKAVAEACPESEKRLIHGDLHPKNIIAQDGTITAIIDWGDLTQGDPATDLAAFWMLFPDKPLARQAALAEYGAQRGLVKRSKGWAIFFGAILLDIGKAGDALFQQVGLSTLQSIAAGD